MTGILRTLAALFALTLAATPHAQETARARIKIGTEGVYPPFNYVERGQLTGFDVDIAHALCERARLQCEIVTQEWDGMIPALLAHRIDAIVASMNITEERQKRIAFTAKYYDTPSIFMAAKADRVTDVSPAALAGKVIGVQGSTTQQNFLEARYPEAVIRTYATVDDASADLAAGRIDLAISDKILFNEWLKRSADGTCCELVGPDLRDALFGAGKGVGVRKEDGWLRETLDAALAAILADGTYQAINDKYFKFPIY